MEVLAKALRREPTGSSPWATRQRRNLTVLDVVARESDLLVTFRWREHPYRLVHALDPKNVMLEGGDLDLEDASPNYWAAEARDELDWVGKCDPLRSRRGAAGDAVEIIEHEPADDRFYTSHKSFSEVPDDWSFVSNGGGPGKPPPSVAEAERDGSLVGWHLVRMEHRYPLPYLGQVATRWEAPGVANVYFIEVTDDMPEILPYVLISSAMQFAASRGASKLVTEIDVPNLNLLGFHEVMSRWETDSRFLDVDSDALDALASRSEWTYPEPLKKAIKRASKTIYVAG